MDQGNEKDERTVYVRNLHEKVTKEILEELFIQIGSVVSVSIRESKGPAAGPDREGERKRFAFVEFQDVESVLFAVEMLDDVELYGQRIVVAPRDRTQQAEKYRQLREQFLQTRVRYDPHVNNQRKLPRHSSGEPPVKGGALAAVLMKQVGNAINATMRGRQTAAAFDPLTPPPASLPQLQSDNGHCHSNSGSSHRHLNSGSDYRHLNSGSGHRTLDGGEQRGPPHSAGGNNRRDSWRDFAQRNEPTSRRSAPYHSGGRNHGSLNQQHRDNFSINKNHNDSKTYFRR